MVIVDVREPDEFKAGHVSGAVNIALSTLPAGISRLGEVPKDSPIIVYCNSGNRSAQAKMVLRLKGYTNVLNGINQQEVERKYL